ncbi:MAG: ATP-grasp domain-containing protein [Oligoflexia bacterium]|nr:ATP-grasp domain-containing protein [Oligoflexia bacterium]
MRSLKTKKLLIIYNQDFNQDNHSDDTFAGDAARASILGVVSAVTRELSELKFSDVTTKPIATLLELQSLLQKRHFDLVINLCESINQDSTTEVQVVKIIEQTGIPFTGNSAHTLSSCLNKYHCNELLRRQQISVPLSILIKRASDLQTLLAKEKENKVLPFPCIVKPNQEDGSTGIDFNAVVHDTAALKRQVETLLLQGKHSVIIQKYINGRELSVAILGRDPKLWAISEIDFKFQNPALPKILNYFSKWNQNSDEFYTTESRQAILSSKLRKAILDTAQKSAAILGLHSYGRIDLRLDEHEIPYIIDVNPNCDLDPLAGFAKSMRTKNLPYPQLLQKLLEVALSEHKVLHAEAAATAAATVVEIPSLGLLSENK